MGQISVNVRAAFSGISSPVKASSVQSFRRKFM